MRSELALARNTRAWECFHSLPGRKITCSPFRPPVRRRQWQMHKRTDLSARLGDSDGMEYGHRIAACEVSLKIKGIFGVE